MRILVLSLVIGLALFGVAQADDFSDHANFLLNLRVLSSGSAVLETQVQVLSNCEAEVMCTPGPGTDPLEGTYIQILTPAFADEARIGGDKPTGWDGLPEAVHQRATVYHCAGITFKVYAPHGEQFEVVVQQVQNARTMSSAADPSRLDVNEALSLGRLSAPLN